MRGCRVILRPGGWRAPLKRPCKALQLCSHAVCPVPCTRRVAKSPADVTKSHALQPQLRFLPLTALKWRQGSVRCFLFSLPRDSLATGVFEPKGPGCPSCEWLNKIVSEPSQLCLHQGKGKRPLTPASTSKVLQEVAKNRAAPPYNTSVLPLTHARLSHPVGLAVSSWRACLTPRRHPAALPACLGTASGALQRGRLAPSPV